MLQKWNFEPGHSAAQFKIRHMMVTWVRGNFSNITGSITVDKDFPTKAKINANIDVKTLYSGESNRDKHLLGPDFFDADKHPKITFNAISVAQNGQNDFEMTGDVTIRGIKKPVTLKVTRIGEWQTPFWEGGVDKGPITRAGFCCTAQINRQDFGVSWNSNIDQGGVVVGDTVYITIDVEGILQP